MKWQFLLNKCPLLSANTNDSLNAAFGTFGPYMVTEFLKNASLCVTLKYQILYWVHCTLPKSLFSNGNAPFFSSKSLMEKWHRTLRVLMIIRQSDID